MSDPLNPFEDGQKRWEKMQEAAKQVAAIAENLPATNALRKDADKVRLDLISPLAMHDLAQVLTFGAKKYAKHNWRKGMDWSRCIASLKRHLNEYEMGIDNDEESGLPHIAHILCNAMFLAEYRYTHKKLDDRYKLPKPNKGG